MTDEKKTPQQGNINVKDITDKLTFKGDPLPIDPETGGILIDELTDKQRAELKEAAAKISEVFNKKILPTVSNYNQMIESIRKAMNIDKLQDMRELLQKARDNLQPFYDLLDEIKALEPYLNTELKKDEYGNISLESIMDDYTPGELLDMRKDPGSWFYNLMEAAKERQAIVERQQTSREHRKAARQKAEEQNAVTELKHGNYLLFSQNELWDAFAPGRICKMGTLSRDYIDKETGLVRKSSFNSGEIETLDAFEISYKALILLNSIQANTVDNIREEPVKHGEITFYVKGVLDSFTDDPRTLLDDQIAFDNTLDRKTAGVLYLEKQFEPLQNLIGTTLNGSRYSVFNYIGYDFETDTMTVQLPYLYELWRTTQQQYFTGKINKQRAIEENKRPKKADLAPLKVNALFKNKAYMADEITLEIAVYITNVLLTAGNTGKPKKTELEYQTIINSCPRFKGRLEEIENNTELKNPAARYNDQLKKIAKAFDLILDPDKCDALNHYEFIDIQPGKITKAGKFEFIPPTKKKIDGKLTIVWSRKPDDDLL